MKRSMTVSALTVFCLAIVAASALGGAGDDQELRALTKKMDRLEREVRDLSKAVRALDKALVTVSKEASTVRKVVKALDERSDKRTLLLGGWFDEYHERSNGRFHREAIRRIR